MRMKKILISLLLVINSSFLFAQTPLTIEGTAIVDETTGYWMGENIPRSVPTTFTFRNNSITSQNASGYMLQAGDEVPNSNSNHLDGEVITGNKFIWNGTDMTSITHGVFTGYNINAVVKYNYLLNVPMGLIRKSNGMTNTSGGVAYNIVISPNIVFVAKGMNNVNVYNNTFYSTRTVAEASRGLINIYANTDNGLNAPSTGIKIKNNIFYTKFQIYNINIEETACLTGFESDYNIFYCESGTPIFKYLGSTRTFAQWQALGYDLHSVVINPNFINFTDLVPAVRLNNGTDLGAEWQTGLSINAVWGTTDPATSTQNGPWQVGARIYYAPVTNIMISATGGANTINTDNGTLQLTAEVLPLTANDKTVTWSIINGTGAATISPSGLVTAVDNGTVTARATANDGSGVFGSYVITNSNQVVPVSVITVTGTGGASTITTENGTLQLSATVLPAFATNKTVTWSIINGTGQASISATGLVTAIADGTVTARAMSNDGSGVFGTMVITNSKSVTGITVTGAGGATTITVDNGTLQLSASVLPVNATNSVVSWSIVTGTELAAINTSGVLTAIDNGAVTVRAAATDGSGVFGTLVITISNQIVLVTGITPTGAGGASSITTDNGTLQLSASVAPANATNKTVTWSVINGSGQAIINASGLLTAVANGIVTAMATANDGSGIYGTLLVTITIAVTGITVSGTGGATTITTDNGTLQLIATVIPASAVDKTVTWSIVNGTGQASINPAGLVTAIDNGTVTARATANDGSGIFGTLIITNSNQIVPVTGIFVTGASGATAITTDKGTLQLSAAVLPANASNKTVTWSLINGSGMASINASGLVTAIDNGSVTARATANDGSGIFGTLTITLTNQIVPVTSISVTGAGGASTITSDNGTLQLSASVLPANATNKTIAWSIVNGTGQATINGSGLVTAVDNGTVTARAAATDGSGVFGTLVITNSNQIVSVTGITVSGAGGVTYITSDNGTLQLSALVLPANATNKSITWSLVTGTGQAAINATGLVTAIDNGTVTARATANDGSGVSGTLTITIFNQIIPVTGITITGEGGATAITTDNGSLQLIASILPSNATNKTVTWSITNGAGVASISTSGLLTALDNGSVTVRAISNDGTAIYNTITITISNQAIHVTGIIVTGAAGSTIITTDNGTLLLSAAVFPFNATNKTVTWSIENGTGEATIDASGIVTAVDNGTVTARATANDGSGVSGTLVITNSNQIVPVTGIIVTGTSGATSISTNHGTLQLNAEVLPANATDKTLTWSIVNGEGLATITTNGLVTAVNDGSVTVRATARDGSGVSGTITIYISGQIIPITGITVTGAGGSTNIATNKGSLQLSSAILPANATNKTLIWSIDTGNWLASVNSTGLVTAIDNGTVTVRATATDGSGIFNTITITISNQIILVSSVTVTGEGGSASINSGIGNLHLSAVVLPANASNKTITWSVENGTGKASISESGLVTAVENGIVTAVATANDGSGVYGTLAITITSVIGITPTDENEPMKIIVNSYEMKIILQGNSSLWKVSLFGLKGSLVMSNSLESDILVMDVSSLATGIYIVVLSDAEKLKISKVIKP
jgi:uncharacterized protein YjdB